LFDPVVQKLDPLQTRIDCVFFDGAANVQKAGRLLAAKYPRMHVQTCAAHCISLFFSDICNRLWQVRLMLLNYRRLYRLFGSGSMHSPYALFISQSKNFNAGRKVGLIRAAGTRMAGHAYAQCRMLRLREPLVATVTSAAFKNLKLTGSVKKVEPFLLNNDMWDASFIVSRCLYPMIRCLRLADKSACGGMSKIVYYVHQTDEALNKSMEALNNLKYFDDHRAADAIEDSDDVLDDSDDDDESINEADETVPDDDEDDDEEEESVAELTFGESISCFWLKRREKLITPLSLAAWFCSPDENIRKDVQALAKGGDRFLIEEVIAKIFYPKRDDELFTIYQTFWTEFDQFQTKTGTSYSRGWIWKSDEIKRGNCHRWHKLYSVPFTMVFGIVACRVCSKPLGCGNAERNWGNFKHLKSGKRSHLSGDKSQKQSTVFGAASLERTRTTHRGEEHGGFLVETRWTDADLESDMGLESWDASFAPLPEIVPRRLFHAWIEEWEFECIHHNDSVSMEKLLHKYGNLRWEDIDNHYAVCVADDTEMDFKGGTRPTASGWCVIGKRLDNDTTESWTIDLVIDEIASYAQLPELNVEVIVNPELRAANKERLLDDLNKRKEAAAAKRARRGG
jgi:hypothetical protein